LFVFEKVSNNVYVFTNRFGTYHAYWSCESDGNIISTFFLGLAKRSSKKQLDWEGITGFLAMGFFPSDKTYLSTIKILQPASVYCFNKSLDLVSSKRYWNWEYTLSDSSVSKHVEELNEVLSSSLQYSLADKRVALPLSGGLDSRTLAGVITSGNLPKSLWGYSYGYTGNSPENKIAGKIAAKKNIAFDSYVVPNYLFEQIDTIVNSVELFQYVDGTRQAFMKPYLENKADVVVGGHWGDVWLNDMGVANVGGIENSLHAAFRKKIIKKGSQWLISQVADLHMRGTNDYLNTYFNDFISKYKNLGNADAIMKTFKTDQWSFRWTLASIRMYQAAVMPVLPFYDKRVADVCMRLPTQQLSGRSLQIEYLKKYHPDLAAVKWQEYDSNLYNYKWLNNRNIAYRVIHKMKRTLTSSPAIIRNADVFYLHEEGKRNLLNVLYDEALLNIVPKEKVVKLIEQYYLDPSAANTYSISMLHTLAQFLKTLND
jgi:asparagine synthase (glutamine-hydrolysing)